MKKFNRWAGSADDLAQYYPPTAANGKNGYIRISRNNRAIYLHRWVWEQKYGPIPTGHQIDHINGIRTDNRFVNLRCIPLKGQRRNAAKRQDNISGVQGVSRWETTRRGNQKVNMWRATCNDKSGKQKIKTFSINKYGEAEAFRLACEARREMEILYDYHPNHGR